MKKLKLQWVSDTIGDSYKDWELGSTVIIEAQTGTGKTWFIKNVLVDYLDNHERLLFVCNRTNLKRQLKIDLLKKFNMPIPIKDNEVNIENLDELTTIRNVTITSYHAIQYAALDEKYDGKLFDLSHFTYCIMDECHYIMADASFVNDCQFAYEKLIKNRCADIIKIFISATINEVKIPIVKHATKGFGTAPKVYEYSTGIDYSYLKPIYFDNNWTDIINTIKNDKTDEKWLIFVSDLRDGNKVLDELGKDDCSLIKAGTKSDELNSIINSSHFNKKVLICTKAMDNGINIDDCKVKNIVIMTWDKITFIQMLGRVRVDISKEIEEVNLYIPTRMKKSFLTKLKLYKQKQEAIDLLESDRNAFNKKYDNKLKRVGEMEDIFYRNKADGEWKVNTMGYARLLQDIKFTNNMLDKFDVEGKFAFITEQLSWIGLLDTFEESNLISEIILDKDIETLEQYLESIVGIDMMMVADRKELIEKIGLVDTHHSNIKEGKFKLLKNINTLNSYFIEIGINFYIKEFETKRIINGKKKNFKSVWKVMRLSDEYQILKYPLKCEKSIYIN